LIEEIRNIRSKMKKKERPIEVKSDLSKKEAVIATRGNARSREIHRGKR
jgi:hypothetical protein